jgi:hypothetical protein
MGCAAGDEDAGERTEQPRQRPAQREQLPDLDAQQAGGLLAERGGAHLQAEVGEAEQREQQGPSR